MADVNGAITQAVGTINPLLGVAIQIIQIIKVMREAAKTAEVPIPDVQRIDALANEVQGLANDLADLHQWLTELKAQQPEP